MVCAIIVPWDCLLRNFSIYTFQLDALTPAFCYRVKETVVVGESFAVLVKWSPLFCSVRTNSAPGQDRLHGGSGLPTVWERFLTGFMWWQEYELHVCLAQQGCVCNALQHFNNIYRTKGNRRNTRIRQSMHFVFSHQKYSQAFSEGTYPRVSCMCRHSPSAYSPFLSHNLKNQCTCT